MTTGKKIGVARTIKARSSIKEPPNSYVSKMRSIMREGAKGSCPIQSAAYSGIFVTTRKWPRMVEPAMSIRVIQAVRRDSAIDLTNPPKLISLLARDNRRTAKVPALPASVGVNNPFDIPPVTIKKMIRTQITSWRDVHLSFHVDLSALGPMDGSILHIP